METTSRSTSAYGFHDFAGDGSLGTDGTVAPHAPRVAEAVRIAFPALAGLADHSANEGGGAATGKEALAGLSHPAQNGPGAVPVFSAPPQLSPPAPRSTLQALQEWEGYVVEIQGGEFVAALVDLTAGSSHEEEEAIIPLAEIAAEDAATLRVGAIFRWVIGYECSPSGTKKRVSQIVFRDLPRMTERDLEQGRKWAEETRRSFNL